MASNSISAERVKAVIDQAWYDNADPDKLFYVAAYARRVFNETVGKFVRAYCARHGRLPEGNHDVLGNGRRMIYFAPVKEGRSPRALVAA